MALEQIIKNGVDTAFSVLQEFQEKLQIVTLSDVSQDNTTGEITRTEEIVTVPALPISLMTMDNEPEFRSLEEGDMGYVVRKRDVGMELKAGVEVRKDDEIFILQEVEEDPAKITYRMLLRNRE